MASPGSVLIIVQNLPVPFDRRVWLEAKTLAEAGYQIAVISPKGKHGKFQAGYEHLEGIHVYRYPAPPEAGSVPSYIFEFVYCWLMTAWLSLRVLRRHGFDVIHACNPPETYFVLAWFYKLFGKRFVFDHHDLSPEMYLAKGGRRNNLFHRGLLWLERMTFRTADVIVTTNESHKQIAMQRGGAPAEKVFIVRTGPDFERLQLRPPEQDLKAGFPFLVCYLGEMCPQDGVDNVLRSAQMLHGELGRDDVRFVLMGGGPSLEDLKRMKNAMGLNGFVEFTGRVSDDDLCRILSTADVCLDPDPYSEWSDQSTMNKIMEYMAFGKPIVAFDLKENRYSAQDAAVYAKADNVREFTGLLNQLLDDEAKRQKMGDYGLERVRGELAWDFSKPHLWAAYRRVME